MPISCANGAVTIHVGDCRETLAALPEASVDACVTDPPYGLVFMAKIWDHGAPGVDFWQTVYRVLKPGAWLLAFGGTRTHHRLVCAIEDAGFEIRDEIQWLYGSGFPKSRNLPGGRGTALKPAQEPICVARKPLVGTVAENVARYGTGVLNIDGCRIGSFVNTTAPGTDRYNRANYEQGYRPSPYGRDGEASASRRYSDKGSTNFASTPGPRGGAPEGRWPANLVHDGSDEVLALFPHTTSGTGAVKRATGAGYKANAYGAESRPVGTPNIEYGDSGSAARFFYCAKASRSERGDGNTHPTVKPLALMRYLCRLITPPGGTVLDPFAGSGTTGLAAKKEGFDAILCEIDPSYAEMARNRIGAGVATTHPAYDF